jgi:hypothetical protein
LIPVQISSEDKTLTRAGCPVTEQINGQVGADPDDCTQFDGTNDACAAQNAFSGLENKIS